MRQGGRDRGKGEGLEGIVVCLVQQGEAHLPFARHATPDPRNRNQYQNTEISWKWEFLIGTFTEWV